MVIQIIWKEVALSCFFDYIAHYIEDFRADYIADYICELSYAKCTRINAVGTKVQFAFAVPVVVWSWTSREVTALSRKLVAIESSRKWKNLPSHILAWSGVWGQGG